MSSGTVLAIEGTTWHYYQCIHCQCKIELGKDERVWCERCRMHSSNPQPKYRLCLRLGTSQGASTIVVWGAVCNTVFGCDVKEMIRKIEEYCGTEQQVMKALNKVLLSEVVSVQYSGSTVTRLDFVLPGATTVLEELAELRTKVVPSTPSPPSSHNTLLDNAYKMFFASADSMVAPPLPSSRRISEHLLNSTPLVSQGYKPFLTSQDTPLSPIVLGNTSLTDEDADCFYMSDIPHLPATRHNPLHERGNIPSQEKRHPSHEKRHPSHEKRHPSHERRQSTPKEDSNEKRENACLTPSLSTSSNDSYSKIHEKRRKRRRCRVQCLIADEPTQPSSPPQTIQVPFRTPHSSDSSKTPHSSAKTVKSSTTPLSSHSSSTDSLSDDEQDVFVPPNLRDRASIPNGLVERLKASVTGQSEEIISQFDTCTDNTESIGTFGTANEGCPDFMIELDDDVIEELLKSGGSLLEELSLNNIPNIQHKHCSEERGYNGLVAVEVQESNDLFMNSVGLGDDKKKMDKVEDSYMMESREERSLFADIDTNMGAEGKGNEDLGEMSVEKPTVQDKSDNSCEDLFDSCADIFDVDPVEEVNKAQEELLGRSKRHSTEFEWENFSQMSTQQLAHHFSFQLSESDGSEELF